MSGQSSRKQKSQTQSRRPQSREERRAEERRAAAAREARKKRQLMVIGAIAAVAVVVVLAIVLIDRDDADSGLPSLTDAPAPLTASTNGLTLGSPDAPIQIVEYGDYQCQLCGDFMHDGFHPLIDEFIASGDVALTYVPTSFLGDESILAAEAAMCANAQGQFWPMHEMLYLNQQGVNQGAFARVRLDRMAEQIDLDMEAFATCMDSGEQRGAVMNEANVAQQSGIASAPTFVVANGEPLGWSSWEALREEIVSALGG